MCLHPVHVSTTPVASADHRAQKDDDRVYLSSHAQVSPLLPSRLSRELSRPAWQEDKHSIVRVKNGGSVNTNGVMHFTDSGFTVAKGVGVPDLTNEDRRWAQRPRHQNHATSVSPLPSLFHSPPTTLELFGERLDTGLLYIKAGQELQWPSSMFSEDGTMLSLGVDGSILLLKHAAAYFGAESDELVPPTVTLVAADLREASRLLEKRLLGGEKAAGVDLSGPKDALKIPGCAGSGAGGKVVLTLTDEGDVVSGPG